jgi:uncharacterized protein (TIGR02646 family)
MRRIKKTHPPKLLREWIEECSDKPNFSYKTGLNSLPEVKAELLEQLIAEQHHLCAYAGVRIEERTCHIEHLKPQNKCDPGEDVDYFNLLACFPEDGGDVSHGFGAPVKGGWWVEAQFVSPLSKDCDRRFQYTWSGKMKPAVATDTAAEKTIDQIGLDCEGLQKLRVRAIRGFFGFSPKSKPLSLVDAEKLLAKIDSPDNEGKLRPFCFVLKYLLVKYIADGKAKKKPKGKK